MSELPRPAWLSNFRYFFFRGLGVLLPSILTIWLLIWAYTFVNLYIAQPINGMIRESVLYATPYPVATSEEISEERRNLTPEQRNAWAKAGGQEAWLEARVRRDKLETFWRRWSVFLDLIGLVVAVAVIYSAGQMIGSIIGRRIYNRGEQIITNVPLISQVYPSVKQVVDFFLGDPASQIQFSRVVAVEYPRKGLWSVGLVTGDTMRAIQAQAGQECLTVFVPSSPTPFTGYVITVPKRDTIDLPVSIEQAIRFTVSGGVLVPPAQQIRADGQEQEPQIPPVPDEIDAPLEADSKQSGAATRGSQPTGRDPSEDDPDHDGKAWSPKPPPGGPGSGQNV